MIGFYVTGRRERAIANKMSQEQNEHTQQIWTCLFIRFLRKGENERVWKERKKGFETTQKQNTDTITHYGQKQTPLWRLSSDKWYKGMIDPKDLSKGGNNTCPTLGKPAWQLISFKKKEVHTCVSNDFYSKGSKTPLEMPFSFDSRHRHARRKAW